MLAAETHLPILAGLAALALGFLLERRRPRADGFQRWTLRLLPLLAAGTALAAWAAFRLVPHWTWSAARLAAAVRLAQGFPLYSGPDDSLVTGWIYGPVGALAYLPAAFAGEPLTALRLATWLNAFYFLVPAVIVLAPYFRAPGSRTTGAALLAFGVGTLLAPYAGWYSAAALNSDVVATTLGILSCTALVRGHRLPLAAALAVAAAWTKQIEAVVAAAQLLYLVFYYGRRTALAYAGWLAGGAAVSSGIFVAWFGAGPLWFCLVTIPSGHPLQAERFGLIAGTFTWTTGWAWALAALTRPWRSKAAADPAPAAPLATLLLLVAALGLPAGLLAAMKAGGDQNSMHATTYAALGGTVLLAGIWRDGDGRRRRLAQAALLAGTVYVTAVNLYRVVHHEHLTIHEPGGHLREAFAFAKSHPGETCFPCNPLINLLAERRNDPFDYGLYDWRLAGRARDRGKVRALLPARLTFIVYHEKDPSFELRHVCTDFTRAYQTGPWDMLTRAPGPTAPPPTNR